MKNPQTSKMILLNKTDMMQIAIRMCYLHDMKVVHCDIKLDNIVNTDFKGEKLESCGSVHVKLIDFGGSKL